MLPTLLKEGPDVSRTDLRMEAGAILSKGNVQRALVSCRVSFKRNRISSKEVSWIGITRDKKYLSGDSLVAAIRLMMLNQI